MNCKRQGLRPTRIKNGFRTFCAYCVADPVRIKLLSNKTAKVGALPAAFRQKHMRVRERFDATLHRRYIVGAILAPPLNGWIAANERRQTCRLRSDGMSAIGQKLTSQMRG